MIISYSNWRRLVFVAGLSLVAGLTPGAEAQSDLGLSDEGFPSFLQAKQVAILSSEVDGRVDSINAEAQDFVAAGVVLIQMDPRLVTLALETVNVNLELNQLAEQEAQVRNDYARDNLKIVQSLFENSVGGIPVSSQKELKESQQSAQLSELAKTKARLERHGLEVERNKNRIVLEKHALVAPFDGVVVPFSSVAMKYLQDREPKRVEVGEVVRAGQIVMAMMRVDKLRVSHWLDVSQLNKVTLGQEVRVHVQGDDQPISARVVFISPTVNPTSQFNIEVEFDNPPVASRENLPRGAYRYRYRDGMRARVELTPPAEAKVQ